MTASELTLVPSGTWCGVGMVILDHASPPSCVAKTQGDVDGIGGGSPA
jgi:hypothetical protein